MKVLVVDDDVVSRMVLMHLVDSCGSFEILEAEDGLDAWSQLEAGLRPAICFCDLRMPHLSGMELLARVKAAPELAALPFVLASSATERETIDQAEGLGVAGYLVKPFRAGEVRRQLAGLCAPTGAAADAEPPLATVQRLGIDSERLLAYLGGFQNQLAAARAELALLPADQGGPEAARARIERLQAGCVTLGLTGCAAALAAFAHGPLDAPALQLALADAVRCAQQQGEIVRRMHASN